MVHAPISLNAISLSFPHKICFENFSTQIHFGARIALIGDNGCGKSSLLHILGEQLPDNARLGYVPQIIQTHDSLSGAERFNKSFSQALSAHPNVLMLDEPTNHLDEKNKKSLLRFLQHFMGTLIIASHDVELLEIMDTLWHIHRGQIRIFTGCYAHYINQIERDRQHITQTQIGLKLENKKAHLSLMKAQERAASSKSMGQKHIQNRKWPTIVSHTKASRGSETTGRKAAEIAKKRSNLQEKMAQLSLPEIIKPIFTLPNQSSHCQTVVEIRSGVIGYNETTLLQNINLSLFKNQRMALMGDNGSGKSTLIKAILNVAGVRKSGYWHTPQAQYIGYLDQHYQRLNSQISVMESVRQVLLGWHEKAIRNFLSDFLFRQHEEVEAFVSTLSGGEKARLSLALIAAQTPQLLLLDEVTNNLDLQTKQHVLEVLQDYPGAMIVISHDKYFLQSLNIHSTYALS